MRRSLHQGQLTEQIHQIVLRFDAIGFARFDEYRFALAQTPATVSQKVQLHRMTDPHHAGCQGGARQFATKSA